MSRKINSNFYNYEPPWGCWYGDLRTPKEVADRLGWALGYFGA